MNKEERICRDNIEAIRKNLAKAESELAKLETTYSIGDRFVNSAGTKRILVARTDSNCQRVQWTELKSGHSSDFHVKNWDCITSEEISYFLPGYRRYWDNVKGVHV